LLDGLFAHPVVCVDVRRRVDLSASYETTSELFRNLLEVELLSLSGTFGRVLEDAFGAGVMDESAACDHPFGHRHLAPGTEAIGKVGEGRRGDGVRCGSVDHGRHFR
jgi:hypothetical protein